MMKYTKEYVRTRLEELADPKLKDFSAALLGEGKADTKMLGVRLPKLRELSKEIGKAEGITYLAETYPSLADDNMEEILLYGMVIGTIKEKVEVLFPYIERYIECIDNWSTCDSFCCGLKQTKKQLKEMHDFIEPYLHSTEEYKIRFGVVMLMDFYILPEYIDEILDVFDSIKHDGYYVKMAVAWALSVCLVKFWDKTIAYMESPDNHLDDFTFIKALQKGRESYRLTAEQKEYLKQLKNLRKAQK